MALTISLLDPLNPNRPPSSDMISLHGGVSGGAWTADRRLWKTADGRVVEDGHPDSAFLFAAPGDQVAIETATEHGLVPAEPPPEPVSEPAPKQAPVAPNKQRQRARDKQAPVAPAKHDDNEGGSQ